MSADLREYSWYHTIDLPDGKKTEGTFDHREVAARLQWPEGLRGGRCLDVGTCDGFWAFEMERRGAREVLAADVDDPERLDHWSPGVVHDSGEIPRPSPVRGEKFAAARAASDSQATRIDCSVYDLDPARIGRFDVVFCGALLLHLRDPVAALESMRSVCCGELVLLECVDAALDLVAPWLPSAQIAPCTDQWWRVNSAGLRQMLKVAGFDVVWVGPRMFAPFGSWSRDPPTGFRPKRMVRSLVTSVLQRRPDAPILARAAGLALGANLLPIRARPRSST